MRSPNRWIRFGSFSDLMSRSKTILWLEKRLHVDGSNFPLWRTQMLPSLDLRFLDSYGRTPKVSFSHLQVRGGPKDLAQKNINIYIRDECILLVPTTSTCTASMPCRSRSSEPWIQVEEMFTVSIRSYMCVCLCAFMHAIVQPTTYTLRVRVNACVWGV